MPVNENASYLSYHAIIDEEQASTRFALLSNRYKQDTLYRYQKESKFNTLLSKIEKQNQEKEYRVSEVYLGCDLLSKEEIESIKKQRESIKKSKQADFWRNSIQNRQYTVQFTHTEDAMGNKAGRDEVTTDHLLTSITPSFDINRNDTWQKRMNSLRKIISLISRYIIQQRVKKRMKKIMDRFKLNNCFTREQVLDFIERENSEVKKSGIIIGLNNNQETNSEEMKKLKDKLLKTKSKQDSFNNNLLVTSNQNLSNSYYDIEMKASFAERYLAGPMIEELKIIRDNIIKKENIKFTFQKKEEISQKMSQRLLYPMYNRLNLNNNNLLPNIYSYIYSSIFFNDINFFLLKKQENSKINDHQYQLTSITPQYYPTGEYLGSLVGAPEETFLRKSNLEELKSKDILQIFNPANNSISISTKVDSLNSTLTDLAIDVITQDENKIKKLKDEMKGLSSDSFASTMNPSTAASLFLPDDSPPDWFLCEEDNLVWNKKDICPLLPTPPSRSYHTSLQLTERDPLAFFSLQDKVQGNISQESLQVHKNLTNPLIKKEKLSYQPDPSLRTNWLEDSIGTGFNSVNEYLLNGNESIWKNHLNERNYFTPYKSDKRNSTPGPLVREGRGKITDKNFSGLSCNPLNANQSYLQWDTTVAPLELELDKKDYLTDSESDEEYVVVEDDIGEKISDKYKPTKTFIKKFLNNNSSSDSFSASSAKTKVDEFKVELVHDQHLLDLERLLKNKKRENINQYYSKLIDVAEKFSSPLDVPQLQLPYHYYENGVYTLYEKNKALANGDEIYVDRREDDDLDEKLDVIKNK